MAVPSFVNAAAQVTSASTASIAVTLPGSRVNNNVIWAFIFVNAASKTIAASAGWTIAVSENTNGASAAFAHRLVDGTETACTFSWTGAASCHGQCQQYTGNATSGYIAATGSNTGTGTAVTGTGLASAADNSLMTYLAMDSINGAFGVLSPPAQYATGGYNTAQGSFGGAAGTILKSGQTAVDFAATISSANWKVLSFVLQGTGSASSPTARASQVIESTLESTNRTTNVLASQAIQSTLESSNRVTSALASQVIIQVLRSVSAAPALAATSVLAASANIITNPIVFKFGFATLPATGNLIANAFNVIPPGTAVWPLTSTLTASTLLYRAGLARLPGIANVIATMGIIPGEFPTLAGVGNIIASTVQKWAVFPIIAGEATISANMIRFNNFGVEQLPPGGSAKGSSLYFTEPSHRDKVRPFKKRKKRQQQRPPEYFLPPEPAPLPPPDIRQQRALIAIQSKPIGTYHSPIEDAGAQIKNSIAKATDESTDIEDAIMILKHLEII